ncbi:hypothetical protein PTKIN_Ptkin18bG0029000 [Pterospermum kingtungense]
MIDMAPTRITLSTMEKRNNETFREYARRWREVATRVKPALESKEFSFMFIRTLKNPYYDRLLILFGNDYADVVDKGELLEGEIKEGREEDASSSKRSHPAKKREGEAHEITFHQNRSRGPRPSTNKPLNNRANTHRIPNSRPHKAFPRSLTHHHHSQYSLTPPLSATPNLSSHNHKTKTKRKTGTPGHQDSSPDYPFLILKSTPCSTKDI